MEDVIGRPIDYNENLYISDDPTWLDTATCMGIQGLVYDYRQKEKVYHFSNTLIPNKKNQVLTDKEISDHRAVLKYSSSSNDSKNG